MTIEYLPWNRPAMLSGRACVRNTDVCELTYAEVAQRVDAVAEQFAAAGIERGNVVAVMLPNQVELLLGLMAAWQPGNAATPVNPVFTANKAGYQIADSAAKLLLTADPGADYGVPVLLAGELNTRPVRLAARSGHPPGRSRAADLHQRLDRRAEGRDARPREPGRDGPPRSARR